MENEEINFDAGEDYINEDSNCESTSERDEYFQSLVDSDY